jgi:hypothetical protein
MKFPNGLFILTNGHPQARGRRRNLIPDGPTVRRKPRNSIPGNGELLCADAGSAPSPPLVNPVPSSHGGVRMTFRTF